MIESSASTSVVNVSRLIDDGPLTRFMDWSRLDPVAQQVTPRAGQQSMRAERGCTAHSLGTIFPARVRSAVCLGPSGPCW